MAMVALIGLVGLAGTGCGEIAIPMWVNIDAAQSFASLDLTPDNPTDPVIDLAIEGGIYMEINVDLSNPLLITGTVWVPDIRMAMTVENYVMKTMCIRRDLASDGMGTLSFNLLTGETEFELPLAVGAYSNFLSPPAPPFLFGFGEITMAPEPGEGDIPFEPHMAQLLAYLLGGEIDGALVIPLVLEDVFQLGGLPPALFVMSLHLVSSSSPPQFELPYLPAPPPWDQYDPWDPSDPDPPTYETVADFCRGFWAEQGIGTMYGISPKGTYLNTFWDTSLPPRIVDLAGLGAVPGDTLRITRHGAYQRGIGTPLSQLIIGVFSAGDTVLGPTVRYRVPGAINAGVDVWTPPTFWWVQPTDIPQDFGIQNSVDVVVPDGATHLMFSTWDNLWWDSLNKAIRVEIEVNPTD